MSGFERLEKEVIGVGLCTDCGNCAGVCPQKLVSMNYESELPELLGKCPDDCELCYESCPGKDIPTPDLDRVTFGRVRNDSETLLGISKGFFKCHAVDPVIRRAGGSGGFVSALLIYALENNVIDGAVLVGMDETHPWRIVPKIATNRQEVLSAAQAKENLVPVNSVFSEVIDRGIKRVGVVGLPCHVHAIRKMQLYNRPKVIIDSIKLVVGLVCGMNWSYRGTEHVIEEEGGIPLKDVAKVEFRSGEYPGDFKVTSKDGKTAIVASSLRRDKLRGFEKDRCTMCYEYTNEVADISVGDYWSPEMVRGALGQSAAIIRTDIGERVVNDAETAKCVQTEQIENEVFFRGLFEQKKHGGALHILKRREYGWKTPDYHLPLEYPRPLKRRLFSVHPYLGGN